MQLIFYHFRLCPRCARARKHLALLLGDNYLRNVCEVDILSHPFLAWKDGIRMIPALTCKKSLLSGITLTREQIEQFLIANDVLSAANSDNQ